MSKIKNPEVDFGFHIVIPRIVRTGEAYKDLSPTQRWLYACLKDLCGDHGTCYRSLRALADETGISIGMLSESIRKLHDCKLIHAEKKRRTTGGKEVWHITIIDVWQANALAHPTKRSQNEQTPQNENVHTANVHTVNNNSRECSPAEQECSHSETEVITVSNTITEAITEDIVDVAPQIDAPLVFHPFHSFIALDDAITPKTLIVYLTSQEYESEIEDDRRSFIAQDVKAELARRGHHVEYRWEREKESVFVDTPSQQNTVEQSTPDVQPTPSQPEQPAPEQQAISVSYSPHDDASQPTLLDVPLGPPTMPPDSAKWNAETMVQIVEVKLGKRFSEVVRGKMSRRERQLNAAERIFKAFKKTTFTRDDFTRAYDERNDAWWRSTKGDLTVEHMAANTTNRVMRTIEVLESLEAKAGKIIQFPGQSQQTPTIPAPAADASPKTLEEVMAELKKVRFELQAMGFSNSQEYRDLKARCMTLDSKRMALLSAQKQAALAK